MLSPRPPEITRVPDLTCTVIKKNFSFVGFEDFLLVLMSFRTKGVCIKMLLWSLQSPEPQEHRVMHFSLFLGFSSKRPCHWKPLSCVGGGTNSPSPFSTTRSQLSEPTNPLSLSLSIYLQSYSKKPLPLLPARTFMAEMQSLWAAESPWGVWITSWLCLRPFSRKHHKTKGKKKKISSKQQLPGNTNAVTWCVNKFKFTIKINQRMISAKVGYKDKPLRAVI